MCSCQVIQRDACVAVSTAIKKNPKNSLEKSCWSCLMELFFIIAIFKFINMVSFVFINSIWSLQIENLFVFQTLYKPHTYVPINMYRIAKAQALLQSSLHYFGEAKSQDIVW